AEDGIRDFHVTGVQTCALPIYPRPAQPSRAGPGRRAASSSNGTSGDCAISARMRPPEVLGCRRERRLDEQPLDGGGDLRHRGGGAQAEPGTARWTRTRSVPGTSAGSTAGPSPTTSVTGSESRAATTRRSTSTCSVTNVDENAARTTGRSVGRSGTGADAAQVGSTMIGPT